MELYVYATRLLAGRNNVPKLLRPAIDEEIGYNPESVRLWKVWPWRNFQVHIFEVSLDRDIKDLFLTKGADMKLFSKEKLLKTDLAFCLNEVFREYFR